MQTPDHIHYHQGLLDRRARGLHKGHGACVIWLTGVPGAGKSTLANLLEARLHGLGCHTCLLDGDNLRHGLNRDLGFSPVDRRENVRRVGETARLMVDAGLIVITALISPFAEHRAEVRALFEEGVFLEIHVHAPSEIAEQRDPKGLYRRARRGELTGLTGVDAPYEAPAAPDLRLDTSAMGPQEAVDALVEMLRQRGLLRETPAR